MDLQGSKHPRAKVRELTYAVAKALDVGHHSRHGNRRRFTFDPIASPEYSPYEIEEAERRYQAARLASRRGGK